MEGYPPSPPGIWSWGKSFEVNGLKGSGYSRVSWEIVEG